MNSITEQSFTAAVAVAVSTVCDHDYTVLSDNINIITGHSEIACQFQSDTRVDKAQNTECNTSVTSTMTDISQEYINSLELECQSLRNKCHKLEAENARLSLSEKSFEGNDVKVKYYTGLPTFHVLMHIFNFISDYLKEQSCLTRFQQFIITLMRIRLNLNVQDLGYKFNVSSSTVSRVLIMLFMYAPLI